MAGYLDLSREVATSALDSAADNADGNPSLVHFAGNDSWRHAAADAALPTGIPDCSSGGHGRS